MPGMAHFKQTYSEKWTVVAQLTECLLPTPAGLVSNPVIGKCSSVGEAFASVTRGPRFGTNRQHLKRCLPICQETV